MIIDSKLYYHCDHELRKALFYYMTGFGGLYKLQIYKGFEHETYGDLVKSGKAIMFTIQQMFSSANLRENKDIGQVKEWFKNSYQSFDIQTVNSEKFDLFVIAKSEAFKTKEKTKKKETAPVVEQEWNSIDATGLAEQPKQNEEGV